MSTHSTQVLEGLLRESRLCGATPLDEVVKMSWFFDEKKLGQVFRMLGQRLSFESHAMNQFRSHSLPTHLMRIFRLSMRLETFRFPMKALVGCADEAHVALLRRASKRM